MRRLAAHHRTETDHSIQVTTAGNDVHCERQLERARNVHNVYARFGHAVVAKATQGTGKQTLRDYGIEPRYYHGKSQLGTREGGGIR
jgi:methionine synthase I (cobalamin-dependent)